MNMIDRDKILEIKRAGKTLSVGGPVVDSEATLCLYAKDIDLDIISSRLGVKATNGIKRGEVVGRRRPAPIGFWSLEAPEELPFKEKLAYLLNATTKEVSTWDSLSLAHDIQLRCAFYLHSWTEGFDLPADIVAEIGNRHWAFGLTAYSAEGDEILDAFLSEEDQERE
jgi:hypothetical protein